MRAKNLFLPLVAAALGVVALSCTNSPDASELPANGRIVFYSDRDGSGLLQVYTMLPDGTEPVNVSNNGFREIFPDVSHYFD